MTHPDITAIGPEQESSTNTKAGEHNCDSRLESLPPEVRRHLLSILHLPQLKVLVRASPTFHQQYLFDRNYVLCRSLEETLGSVTVDAYAVHLLATQDGDTKQTIAEFLEPYSENTLRRCLPFIDRLTQDEAISMVAYYFHSIKPISEYYAALILDNLAHELRNGPRGHQKAPGLDSETERMRLTRAVYRFQLLCQLVDPDQRARAIKIPSQEAAAQDLLNVLQPWEVEELVSIYQFVEDVYNKIFDDVTWDLHPDNPRYDDQRRPPTPDGAFELHNPMIRDYYIEGITFRGLSVLRTVLFEVEDHQHLVFTIQQHIISSYIPFKRLDGILGETQQTLQRRSNPSERDRLQAERAPCPFRGDAEADAPPLAWTIIWGDTYSNLYGYYIPDEMRLWGYIFYDATTFEGAGLREVLKRQWEKEWDDEDPRDTLL